MVRRVFITKKHDCDIQAAEVLADLKENLHLNGIDSVSVFNRYDIEGISNEHYEICKTAVFYEPPVDDIYEEKIPEEGFVFGVKYLPGQYDQRADSVVQCVQIVTGATPQVECAKIYVIKGHITSEEKQKIKNYLINPVDSMEAGLSKPETLKLSMKTPEDIKYVNGFISMSNEVLCEFRTTLGLAMSIEDLIFCRDYFASEQRDPSITEIRVIDTYWSDHCRHTTFLTSIENVEFMDGLYTPVIKSAYDMYLNERKKLNRQKDICLMDIAVTGMKALKEKGLLNDLDESEEINACSIVVPVDVDGKTEDWLVMFKNETHNHPTEIEPFGGAATCLGGAIRDPLSGRSFVYQAMRVTGSGDPRTPISETLSGKLPQRKITQEAAHGYSSYGNQIGLATGLVTEIYDEGYVAKRMEIGAVIGAAKKENVIRKSPEKGDVVILVGGRTGRDGCGGATGSSKEHSEESILTCGAEVQKGNPPTERKLQRLFRNPEVSRLIKRCNDFGAGGVSVAIGELAEGLNINLDKVLKKYEGLDGTELAISESQERMAVVVAPKDTDKFIEMALTENLEATVVAYITDDRRLKMFWRGNDIVNISRDFLDSNGAKHYANAVVEAPVKMDTPAKREITKDDWLESLRDLNVCSQKGLAERFCSTIGKGTVLMPFGGKYQLTPAETMAAKIPANGETDTVTLMSYGYDPNLFKWSPFHGAVLAIIESITKIVASGGDYRRVRLTLQEYFEKLGTDNKKWGKPLSALLGAFYTQMMLGIPAIGGKDSMSGSYNELSVPPTLVSFALGIGSAEDVISPEFKTTNNTVAIIKTDYDENDLPVFKNLTENFKRVHELIKNKVIVSARAAGYGGVETALSKMCVGNMIGIELNALPELRTGSIIVELDTNYETELKDLNYQIIGRTIDEKLIRYNNIEIKLDEIIYNWMSPLEKVFPTKYFDAGKPVPELKQYKTDKKNKPVKIAKPRVIIPVFPGTNCEYDMANSFEKAGAIVDIFVIKNLDTKMLEESIKELAKKIRESQIISLVGGFSAGDEPDGSGKFIAAIFKNPYVKEETLKLINDKDGLMLGICNGFQALIKLGLVPYGDIRDLSAGSPTLSYNEIGRHVSILARTKVISNKSPWLWKINPGDIHLIPASHGEGRFIADERVIKELAENGQIATQYVDIDGRAAQDARFNPNGSIYAIEGITSPDGRILGKMGHSERVGKHLYKNVLGEKDQKLFESGVDYYG